MHGQNKNLLLYTLLTLVALTLLWLVVPKPELLISIMIRMASAVIAAYLVIKYREWKLSFLAVMFSLMALRQALTGCIWMELIEPNAATRALSEVPGFLVTILSLLSIIYIGMVLGGKIDHIKRQESELATLQRLLPICSCCKKIKDSEGYWEEIEAYIQSHTDTRFSHGLCEECAEKLYGKEKWYKEKMT